MYDWAKYSVMMSRPTGKLNIDFCKSVSNAEIGIEILRLIHSAFSGLLWDLVVEVNSYPFSSDDPRFLEEHENAGLSSPQLLTVSIEDYARLNWAPKSGDCILMTQDRKYTMYVNSSGAGDSKVVLFQGKMDFRTKSIAMVLQDTENVDLYDCAKQFIKESCSLLDTSYANINLLNQKEIRPISSAIPGIFWFTLLGKDYVDLIGAENFVNLPCYHFEWLPDGSAAIQLTESIEQSDTAKANAVAKEIKNRLGNSYFLPKSDPLWFPPLRNLALK
jgi:hypothetical protein